MADINRVEISGRLAKDPDVRYTKNGKAVLSMTVAVNREKFEGQEKDIADFINVTAWGKLAEDAGNVLSKGSPVNASGRLARKAWEDKNGVKRYDTEVIASYIGLPLTAIQKSSVDNSAPNSSVFDSMGSDVEEEIPF